MPDVNIFTIPKWDKEAYSEPSQTSKVKLVEKIANRCKALSIFEKAVLIFDWVLNRPRGYL